MNIVYFSHSYNDPLVNEYFSQLIQSENLTLSLDPPSNKFNAAKLIRHLDNCDGMIALLSRRSDVTITPFEKGTKEDDLLTYVAAIDSESKFLIARGVTFASPALPRVTNFQLIPGRGGSGTVEGAHNVTVATADYLEENDTSLNNSVIQRLPTQYDVRQFVLIDGVPKGAISVRYRISSYVRFEISQCLKAQKPLLVFVDDVLEDDIIPSMVLQRRFSRRSLIRQMREHRHALEIFKTYLGESCPPRYQPFLRQKTCLLIGFAHQNASLKDVIRSLLNDRGYVIVELEEDMRLPRAGLTMYDVIASADLAVCMIDGRLPRSQYLIGAINWASVPTITLTSDPAWAHLPDTPTGFEVPGDFEIKHIDSDDLASTKQMIETELNAFEEDFLELYDREQVKDYTDALIEAHPSGQYSPDTRSIIIGKVFGGKINIAEQVGGDIYAETVVFNEAWDRIEDLVSLESLRKDLERFRAQFETDTTLPQEERVEVVQTANEIGSEIDNKNGGRILQLLNGLGKYKKDLQPIMAGVGANALWGTFITAMATFGPTIMQALPR